MPCWGEPTCQPISTINNAEPPLHYLPKLCAPADVHQGGRAHWSMAKIDFTYECANCGAQIRQTVTKPELLN